MLKKVKHIIIRPILWFRSASRKKKIITIVVSVIVLFFVLNLIGNSTKPPPYTLAKVERGNVSEIVSETGNVITNNSTEVFSPTNGIVEEVMVDNGSIVKEGDIVFKVKSTATDQEALSAQANYLAAVAALNASKSTADTYRAEMYGKWKSYTDLSTNGQYQTGEGNPKAHEREAAEFQISQDQWKSAEARYKDQETAIAQAQAAVSSTQLLYQATQNATVKAPADGTVANLSLSEGGTVKAQTQSLTASTIVPALSLVRDSKTEAVVSLNESDALKVKRGQQVTLDVNAVDDKIYKGVVVRVDDIGSSTQGVVQYNAYVAFTDPDNQIKSGLTVDVTVTTKEVTDTLTVPNAAVKPYKGGRAVRTIDPKSKQPVFTPVEIGVKGKTRTQILKGLTEGQQVVTALSNELLKKQGMF